MADRTSAYLFKKIFERLAKTSEYDLSATKDAKEFYEMTKDFDFNLYQMYCDDELIKLGLAKRDGEAVLYLNEDYYEE